MGFAKLKDLLAIEKESKWEDRDLPATLFGLLSRTAQSFPNYKTQKSKRSRFQ